MDWIRNILTATQDGAEENAAVTGMVDAIDILLMAMLLACGIYAIYTAIRLHRNYYLEPNKLLYPTDCTPETCLDSDGFIDYILPRLTGLGIAMLVQGIVLIVNSYVLKFEAAWLEIVMIVLPAATVGYYIVMMRKAAKKFWNI